MTAPQPVDSPPGVELHDWNDIPGRRKAIYDSSMTALQKQFPMTYSGVRLELHNPRYEGPEEYTLADQKKALLDNRYLHRKIRGTVRLMDATTGQMIEENDMTLMKVPFLTERGTFVHNGSEYTTMNQARLLPGVFVRRKATGELESHFNVKRGTGNSFRVHLEPESGLFKMEIGQASLRLYSLLHDLGVPDEKLEKVWGPDLLEQNRSKYDARVFDKAYARLVRRPDPLATREDKAKAIQAALGMAMLSRHVLDRTLPNRFNKLAFTNPPQQSLLAASEVGGDEQTEFAKADYLLLAKFLNDKFKAGIPLDLPTAQLVSMITEKLHEYEPLVNEEMMAQSMPIPALNTA